MNQPNELFDDLIDAVYLEDSAAAWAFVRAHGVAILDRLGFWDEGAGARTTAELVAALEIVPERAQALDWLLAAIVAGDDERLARDGDRWVPGARPGADDLGRARRQVEVHERGVGSSIPLIEYVADRYPDFLRGERSGPMVLLKGEGLELWEGYFSATNPLYDVHNVACARGLRRAIAGLGRAPRVLELGAGTGGATAGLLAEIRAAGGGGRLTISDTAPSFLFRIGERMAAEDIELERQRIDFSRPFADQGVEPGSVDAVVAVNALHNAQDMAATLDEIAGVVAPGGALVVSESLCGADEQVHQDFVFNLLPNPSRSAPAAGGSSGSRFLTVAEWRQVFERAPFEAEIEFNRLGPELALVAVARPKG